MIFSLLQSQLRRFCAALAKAPSIFAGYLSKNSFEDINSSCRKVVLNADRSWKVNWGIEKAS